MQITAITAVTLIFCKNKINEMFSSSGSPAEPIRWTNECLKADFVNIAKFLRTVFLIEHLWQLLLFIEKNCCNGSINFSFKFLISISLISL